MVERSSDGAGQGPAPFLGGRLVLHQARGSHRAGTDAVLLAAAVPTDAGPVLADVGAGVGTVGLAVAARCPDLLVHLVEKDPAAAALAVRNVEANGFGTRAQVHAADLFDPAMRETLGGRMNTVVSNPPFYLADRIRAPQNSGKASAYVLENVVGGHGAWLRALFTLLAPHGLVAMIHRPEALPALLAAAENRIGAIAVRPVHARESESAGRILFAGVLGSRAPMRIEPPLVLHEADGSFTPTAEALHRGTLVLPFTQRKSRPRGPALSPRPD